MDLSKYFDLTKIGTYTVQVTSIPSLLYRDPVTTSLSKNVGNYANQKLRRADEIEHGEQLSVAEMSISNIISITITPDNVPNNPFLNDRK